MPPHEQLGIRSVRAADGGAFASERLSGPTPIRRHRRILSGMEWELEGPSFERMLPGLRAADAIRRAWGGKDWKPLSLVRFGGDSVGMRMRLPSGDDIVMPLGRQTRKP